jgi:lipoprotein-anchoring transpeptidase ErfK/SrfK
MANRSFIGVAAVLVVLLVGAAGVYAYDRAGRDTIPKGVRVAGVDVGGLSASQARAKLADDYLARLRRPVVVRHGRLTFTLTARESRVAADIEGMVQRALAEARTGNLLGRTWRRLTGGTLHVAIPATATFDEAAAARLVDRVRKAIDRPAKDASVAFSTAGPSLVPGRDGVAVLAQQLQREVDRAIVDPEAAHALVARTRVVPPKVTTTQLDRQYATALVVDREHFELKLFKDLKLVKTYPVAIGMVGLETPAGLYHIQDNTIDPAWTEPNSSWVPARDRGKVIPGGAPDNPLKARWLGIFNGAGIHGIDPSEYGSIGHAASHGCVRMRIPDVIDLYPQVPVGAPIYIA